MKSTLPVQATTTGLVCNFAPSCQATTLYLPSGTFSILKFPAASVSAKYGVGLTMMKPAIDMCTLHNSVTTPGVSKLKGFVWPWDQVP